MGSPLSLHSRHRPRHLAGVVVTVLSLAFSMGAGAAGQQRTPEVGAFDSLETLPSSFSPRTGPRGTSVTLSVQDLPVAAPLRVGVGSRFGFEEVGWVMSDNDGTFTFELTIPAGARLDVANYLIVFDPYFRPIGITEPFHVTDADGMIHRRGTLIGLGTPCLSLLASDGMRYALFGNVGSPTDSAEVAVAGTISDRSPCSGRTAIEVSSIGDGNRR